MRYFDVAGFSGRTLGPDAEAGKQKQRGNNLLMTGRVPGHRRLPCCDETGRT